MPRDDGQNFNGVPLVDATSWEPPSAGLGILRSLWRGRLEVEDAMLFLSLDRQVQVAALRRLQLIDAYAAGWEARVGEVERILGMARSYFYTMAREFSSSRRMSVLVRWPRQFSTRGRSASELALIERVSGQMIRGRGAFNPASLGERLRRAFGKERAPSRSTVDALFRATVPSVEDGFRMLPEWADHSVDDDRAKQFGRLILIDQVRLERSRDRHLSVVFDARTRVVIGWRVGDYGPRSLAKALEHAAQRAFWGWLPRSDLRRPPDLRGPRIPGESWGWLFRAIAEGGFNADLVGAPLFETGGFTGPMLGSRLGCLDLRESGRGTPTNWSPDDVHYAIRSHNLSRTLIHRELAGWNPDTSDDDRVDGDEQLQLSLVVAAALTPKTLNEVKGLPPPPY